MNDIGHIISHYRKQNNMSQQELADLLQKKGFKISYKAVSKWETNVSEPGINLFFENLRQKDVLPEPLFPIIIIFIILFSKKSSIFIRK